MTDRIQRIIEAGEAIRAYDIDLGRNLERERIIKALNDYVDGESLISLDVAVALINNVED
jgi:hypothetical protein